jgi:F1F0 ATPase subunit 2
MSDVATLFIVLITGVLLGACFFGSLWWTVQKGLRSKNPIWWFFGSSLLRMGLALASFYFIAGGDWRKLVVCLLGFVIARFLVTRLTRTNHKGIHAP